MKILLFFGVNIVYFVASGEIFSHRTIMLLSKLLEKFNYPYIDPKGFKLNTQLHIVSDVSSLLLLFGTSLCREWVIYTHVTFIGFGNHFLRSLQNLDSIVTC